MSVSKYRPKTTVGKLAWVVEECGEVCAAIGKTERRTGGTLQRLMESNPELPEGQGELNGDWILREMQDLKKALELLEEDLRSKGFGKPAPLRPRDGKKRVELDFDLMKDLPNSAMDKLPMPVEFCSLSVRGEVLRSRVRWVGMRWIREGYADGTEPVLVTDATTRAWLKKNNRKYRA